MTMLALAERPCGYQVLSSPWFHARLFPRVFAVRTSLKGSHLQETPPWDVHRRSQKSVSTCNARTASISVRVLLVTVVALENSSDSCTPICVPGWESHRCSGNGQSEWIWIFQFRTIWIDVALQCVGRDLRRCCLFLVCLRRCSEIMDCTAAKATFSDCPF